MALYPYEYTAYGRRFKVERVENSTRWHAVGRGAGQPAYLLDKIGDDAEQDGMQRKLDAWAKRQGCRPVNAPKAQQEMLSL